MEKKHQVVSFTENSIAVTALVAIFSISIFTVISLNPVANPDTSGQVAGISTETNTLVIENMYYQSGHIVEASRNEEGNFEIGIIANKLPSGSYTVDLAKFTNLAEMNSDMYVQTEIEGQGREHINLFVEKDQSKYLIFRENTISGNKIPMQSLENGVLKLRFDISSSINFPVKLTFEFSS